MTKKRVSFLSRDGDGKEGTVSFTVNQTKYIPRSKIEKRIKEIDQELYDFVTNGIPFSLGAIQVKKELEKLLEEEPKMKEDKEEAETWDYRGFNKMKVETLAKRIHEEYQVEAKRQGDVRHHDDYERLPENIKNFDRRLAHFILEGFIHIEKLKKDYIPRSRIESLMQGIDSAVINHDPMPPHKQWDIDHAYYIVRILKFILETKK